MKTMPPSVSNASDLISISLGLVNGRQTGDHFGIGTIDIADNDADIWSGGVAQKTWLTSAETMTIVSTSAEDDLLTGTGAQKVTIEGLDGNYNPVSETLDMDGLTPVVGSQLFLRINDVFVSQFGGHASGSNVGLITITQTTSLGEESQIIAGAGHSLETHWSVKAGWTFHMMRFFVNIGEGGAGQPDSGTFKILWRRQNGAWNIIRQLKVVESHIAIELHGEIKIPEKSDIVFRFDADQDGTNVGAGFDFLEIDNAILNA